MSGFVKIAIDDYYSDSNWTTIINKYWMLAERVSDPRVHGWLLFDTPLPTLAIVLTYLSFVTVIGPMWMANRKPFKLKKILVAYNAGQVLLSTYMFYEHLMSGWWGDYSLSCQPVDYSESDQARRMLHLCWVYYYSKLSEFADTTFFVLRKKKSQITWLHLYHHSLTPFEAWLLVKFVAGGHGSFSNIVNNFVHVIMYAYYMMAAMGPQYQKYLWWKKHLTTVQLIQFFMVLIHSISALVYDCGYPKFIAAGLVLHSAIFILLFMNFYTKAYSKRKKPLKPVEPNNNIDTAAIIDTDDNNQGINVANVDNKLVLSENSTIDNCEATANGHVNNATSKATLNGHIENIGNGNIKLNGYYNNIPNGISKSNGQIKSQLNGYVTKDASETNGHIHHGYTNGHLPKEKDQ